MSKGGVMKSKKQKYSEAVERNLDHVETYNYFGSRTKTPVSDLSFKEIKQRIGIRTSDNTYDSRISNLKEN
jgi:hypothetical protein